MQHVQVVMAANKQGQETASWCQLCRITNSCRVLSGLPVVKVRYVCVCDCIQTFILQLHFVVISKPVASACLSLDDYCLSNVKLCTRIHAFACRRVIAGLYLYLPNSLQPLKLQRCVSWMKCVNIYIYMCVCVYIYIYIYDCIVATCPWAASRGLSHLPCHPTAHLLWLWAVILAAL